MGERLLERGAELRALEAAVGEAATGRGGVVLVSGEAGIGKTSLVRAFLKAVPHSARLLVGACDDLVTPRTFGPLRDAVALSDGPLADELTGEPDGESVYGALLEELSYPAHTTVLVVEATDARRSGRRGSPETGQGRLRCGGASATRTSGHSSWPPRARSRPRSRPWRRWTGSAPHRRRGSYGAGFATSASCIFRADRGGPPGPNRPGSPTGNWTFSPSSPTSSPTRRSPSGSSCPSVRSITTCRRSSPSSA